MILSDSMDNNNHQRQKVIQAWSAPIVLLLLNTRSMLGIQVLIYPEHLLFVETNYQLIHNGVKSKSIICL